MYRERAEIQHYPLGSVEAVIDPELKFRSPFHTSLLTTSIYIKFKPSIIIAFYREILPPV